MKKKVNVVKENSSYDIIKNCERLISNDLLKDARSEISKLVKKGNTGVFYRYQSTLEALEYNFNEAFNLLDKCLDSKFTSEKDRNNLFFRYAFTYFIKGDFASAKSLFKQLENTESHGAVSQKFLIYISMLEKNYNEALERLAYYKVTDKNFWNVEKIKGYINYYTGKTIDLNSNTSIENSYFFHRLINDNPSILLNNICENFTDSNSNKYFIEGTNIINLIGMCEERIKDLNPTYLNYCRKYIINFEENLAIMNKRKTSSICVYTLDDDDKILTIKPVQISPKFDNEGFARKRV